MFKKYLRHLKYKKMVRVNSTCILQDLLEIINETTQHFKNELKINSMDEEEMIKFEATAMTFWIFQKTIMFPEIIHRLLLDEIHDQYYKRLKKSGYNSKLIQAVCDNFNLRYKAYNEAVDSDNMLYLKFAEFLAKDLKIKSKLEYSMIPIYLIEKLELKFEEIRNVIK